MTDRERLLESWKAEFRAAYDDDPRNAARQPFPEYWRWVVAFFVTGGFGQRGWLDQVDLVLRGVRDEARSAALRARLRETGRAIAADWSKESRYRRIHTTPLQGSPNLQQWGAQLQRAAEADAGDGAAIERAMARIERELSGLRGEA